MNKINHNTAIIILAGGQSTRAETIKGLRTSNGDYWLDIQIRHFMQLGFKNINIGLGYDYKEYLNKSVHIHRCHYYINKNPERGAFSTLQTVLTEIINQSWQNLLLLHIDHALPNHTTINALLKFKAKAVCKPTLKKKSGHPILLNHKFCEKLVKQPYVSQLNQEIQNLKKKQIQWIAVDDHNILANFNTNEQWKIYKNSV